jgi:hypothetical protein
MRPWTTAVVAVAGGMVGSIAATVAVGRLLWDRSTARSVRRLVPDVSLSRREVFSHEQLEGLPRPVARYFEFALTPGQPLIRSARVEQRGEFRTGGSDAPWSPLIAIQQFSTDPPGFIWDASIRVAPFLSVRVRDTYIGGAGSMQAKLASLVPVVDQRGRPELAAGALHRYLAEAVWFPTALLPSQGIMWESIDSTMARATLTDAGTTVSLEFQFGPNGQIVRAYTPERYRELQGKYVPTPWACSYWSYAPIDGMRVPMEAEVEWTLPEGQVPYWRGRILAIECEFAP